MPLSFRIALRELAGSWGQFRIYIACILLGTAAIAASGSVAEMFTRGLASEARTLLGGDLMLAVSQRRLDIEERDAASGFGMIAETVELNVMASAGDRRRQIDLRGVEPAWPLVGAVDLAPGETVLSKALARRPDGWGMVVSASFLESFSVDVGDRINFGSVDAVIAGVIISVPDRVGTPGGFGPEGIISLEALEAAGRLTPGQLFRSRTVLVTTPETDSAIIKKTLDQRFSDSGLRIREPADAVDGLSSLIDTLSTFLSIIGVAALLAGGVGVAQATSSFLQTRTEAIATLKAFGASGPKIRLIYGVQLLLLAATGASGGIVIGAATPYLLIAIAGDGLTLPSALGVYPVVLIKAFILGLLAAAVFALVSLGRARATSPAVLFRGETTRGNRRPPAMELGLTLLALMALIAIAVLSSASPLLTLALLGGSAVLWGLLFAIANLIRRLAAGFASRARGIGRIILANLAGSGSLALTVVPALGLGLALLCLVASVQANLLRQIAKTAPENAPSLVFSQIPFQSTDRFDEILAEEGVDISDPDAFRRAPFLLGRVISLNGNPIVEEDVAPSERWIVRGETSLTYLARRPPDVELVDGDWWAEEPDGRLARVGGGRCGHRSGCWRGRHDQVSNLRSRIRCRNSLSAQSRLGEFRDRFQHGIHSIAWSAGSRQSL